MEIQIKLPTGFIGEFVGLQVKMKVDQKITRFVTITKGGEKEWYQVKYEKLPMFCANCGLLGHWHQEYGSGEHDESKFEWGDFILADGRRSRGRSRDGRDQGTSRGMHGDAGFGRGRGRGFVSLGRGNGDMEENYPATSWHFNSMFQNDGTVRGNG